MSKFLEGFSAKESVSYSLITVSDNMAEKLKTLMPSEEVKYSSFNNDKRKREWLAGRYAGKKALYNHIGVEWAVIDNKDSGVPYFPDYPEHHLSISHSGNYALAMVSNKRIGVDIEQIEERPLSLCKYFYSDKEKNEIERSSKDKGTLLINKFWTRKEAVSKLLGLGGKLPFNKLEVVDDTISLPDIQSEPIKLLTEVYENYIMSIAVGESNG